MNSLESRRSDCVRLLAGMVFSLATGIATAEPSVAECVPFPTPASFHAPTAEAKEGDFNSDGAADILLPSGPRLFMNAGDGTFAEMPLGFTGIAGAIGDLDLDGALDLVLVSDGLEIKRGAGDGTFITVVRYAVPTGLAAIDDFNRDGVPDVAVLNGNALTVYPGAGGGFLGPGIGTPSGFSISEMTTGDFNGDGSLDVATINLATVITLDLAVFFGRGDGSFAPWTAVVLGSEPPSVRDVDSGDFNSDGRDDIVVSFLPCCISILLGPELRPAGSSLPPGAAPIAVRVADVNADGHVDILVADRVFSEVWVHRGLGAVAFAPPVRATVGGLFPFLRSFAVADFNVDGAVDLAVPRSSYGDVAIVAGAPDGSFGERNRHAVGGSPFSIATTDLNRDLLIDVVVADQRGLSTLIGTGGGDFAPYIAFPSSAYRSTAVGDLNGDGAQDVVAVGWTSGLAVYIGGGDGTLAAPIFYVAGDLPTSVALSYLDSDGTLDAIVANSGSDDVSVFLGRGDGAFTTASRWQVGSFPVAVAAAELNGDGNADVVAANQDSGDVSILFGDGTGGFAAQVRHLTGGKPASLALADVNRDGMADLQVATHENQISPTERREAVVVSLAAGGGAFTPATVYALGTTQPDAMVATDLERDGTVDIVVTGSNNDIAFLRGPGDGTFPDLTVVAAGGNPRSIVVADVNSDSLPDLILGVGGQTGEVDVVANGGDGDGDGLCTAEDNCVATANPGQEDTDGDGLGDLCDNCPTIVNPDQDPEACDQRVVDITISALNPAGRGSGLVSWRTTHEVDVLSFNVIAVDMQGRVTRLNSTSIICEGCVTGASHTYSFLVPKHKSGRGIHVELVRRDGTVERYGPAAKL